MRFPISPRFGSMTIYSPTEAEAPFNKIKLVITQDAKPTVTVHNFDNTGCVTKSTDYSNQSWISDFENLVSDTQKPDKDFINTLIKSFRENTFALTVANTTKENTDNKPEVFGCFAMVLNQMLNTWNTEKTEQTLTLKHPSA